MAAMTAVQNSPAITLLATGPGGPTSLNSVYSACDPTNGNFFTTTNRDLVTFYLYPATAAAPWQAGTTYTAGQVVNFSLSAAITNVAITSNVATITAVNTFQPGDAVALSGLTTATFLNAQTLTVITSLGTTFTANFTHADYASAPDTGSASIANNAYIAKAYIISGVLQTNINIHPTSTAGVNFWTVYSGSSTVTLFSAPDACTGRKSDVNNYNIPLGAGSVEFLVLPSSVFTQANGQFQFQASSNLVYVYVRNL
jgi:hypothetical protein